MQTMKNKVEKDTQEVGKNVGFERIRRITGYLAGDVRRFNNGKRAEEKDRVKHTGAEDLVGKRLGGKSFDTAGKRYEPTGKR